MFSSRVPARLETNALARALARARGAGRTPIDLTLTNPTRAGIVYPPDQLRALAMPDAAVYTPDAFGLRSAREAVAGDYARRGLQIDWRRIVLTASTSEAYSLLFKLLCAPSGDAVLVPTPSYPLFEHLTDLDGVRSIPYRLEYHGRWSLDTASLDDDWDPPVRAVLAVSPNNPTGSVLTAAELSSLDLRAAARDAAVILDEVFADYPLEATSTPIVNAAEDAPSALTFRLGGLSKSAGLPQVKLGWIAVGGPAPLVDAALERLELICDTYLSVSTPAQMAAGELIASGASVRAQILDRVRTNYAWLRRLAAPHPAIEVLHAEAGWSAVLRIPARRSEEETVVELVEQDGVVVHPGFFFDFPREAYLVVSLLPDPAAFGDGVGRMLERVDG